MDPLPFRLTVPGRDLSRGDTVAWTTFRVGGLLSVETEGLRLEWSGTGLVDAVDGMEVRSESVPLPAEVVEIPFARLRAARVVGFWWRSRLELVGADLAALQAIPGSAEGRLQLRIAREHRALAVAIAESVTARQAAPTPTPT